MMPNRRTAEPPNRRTAEPPNRRTAEPPNRRTAEPPNRRTAEPPNWAPAGKSAAGVLWKGARIALMPSVAIVKSGSWPAPPGLRGIPWKYRLAVGAPVFARRALSRRRLGEKAP
ncbi:hypothetical protein AB870_25885 [Pandoraea faecigallinarum]|uniref:Uncharacterized protein n=1 Tax=Pandoraea faecigallinarum TaxID=656179 RepID=A0A173GZV8_9BURK|nr:hypothetical protein AB870_25885 [Pandoraea faecigallinarum]